MSVFVSAALALASTLVASTESAPMRFGASADGRPLRAELVGRSDAGRRILVVGCIHGDECAGSRVTRTFRGPVTGAAVWLVHNLNPDGLLIGTRLNARGVDLNRNFGADWRPIGDPWDLQHSGSRPFSEPETRAARRLIYELRPRVTIWFHQQSERLVRAWGPSVPAARVYARAAGLPFVKLPWMDGTAPNWQNRELAGTASFVVEMPLGSPGRAAVRRHHDAITAVAGIR